MNRGLLTVGGIAIALLALVSVNLVAQQTLRAVQLDLTEDELYTLSVGTGKILDKLDGPIELKLFFSDKVSAAETGLSSYRDYAKRVEELLRQFERDSRGQLTLEVLDPEPFSEIEDRAVQFQVEGHPLRGTKELFYFGLAGTNQTDKEEVIPFLDASKETTLEYDVAKLVYSLSQTKKPVLGVISSLPIEGEMPNPFMPRQQGGDPWFVMDQLRQVYETRTIQPNAKVIPEDVSMLLVVHPKGFPPALNYAIDQFVLKGGKALVFVDPYCEADVPMTDPNNPLSQMTAPRNSELKQLFEAWGVELADGKLAADRTFATRDVTYVDNRDRKQTTDYVVWLMLDDSGINQQEIATQDLRQVWLKTPGVLKKREGATTELVPLFETSNESMEVAVSQVQFQRDPQALLSGFVSENRKLTLGARISGVVKSAFPSGPPPDASAPEEGEEAPPALGPHVAESTSPIHVVVIADCDFLTDGAWVRVANFGGMRIGEPMMDNGGFVINVVDFMQGSTDLVSLRSRRGIARPFTAVDELRREAEQRYRAEQEALEGELEQAEQKLTELQSKKQGSSTAMLSPEQVAEIESIREKQIQTRKNLRSVQHNLDKDVESLGRWLMLFNTLFIPLVVVVIGLTVLAYRVRRRRAA